MSRTSPPTQRTRAKRVVVVNRKGGVGKTTLVAGVGRQAAQLGLRVLLIDGDPQGNLSTYLTGLESEELTKVPTYASVLIGDCKFDEARVTIAAPDTISTLKPQVRDAWTGVDLLPGSPSCAGLESALGAADLWNERDMLDQVENDYDLILIDCPPTLGFITLLHMYSVDWVSLITRPEGWSIGGLNATMATLTKVRRSHPDLQLAGVVINGLDQRIKEHRRLFEALTEQLGHLRVGDPIPHRTIVETAKGLHLPVAAMPGHPAAEITHHHDYIANHYITLEDAA